MRMSSSNTPIEYNHPQKRSRVNARPWIALVARGSLLLAVFLINDRVFSDVLERGLKRGYGLDQPADVLCVGHSHTALGIDQQTLAEKLGLRVAKYAMPGANAADRLTMVRHYVETYPSRIKLVVYDVDDHTFTGEGLSANSYSLFYPFMDSPSVESYVRRNAPSIAYQIRRFIKLTRFNLDSCNASVRGWTRSDANLKRGTADVVRLRQSIDQGDIRRISFDRECFDSFQQTLDFLHQQRIPCVLLYIPTIDVMNEAEPEKHAHAVELLQDYARRFNHVMFLDYNALFSRRHELFYDAVHLNQAGRVLVTRQLAADLRVILENPSASRAFARRASP
jgi:hypothetical protein